MKGFNALILSFLLTSGPVDQVEAWTQLSAQERADILTLYHGQGISIMVSAFGSTDTPTTDGVDPVASAEAVAAFVKEFDLDGVDVDYEDAVALSNGQAVQWLIAFTKTLRAALPTDSLISHAPQGPNFGPTVAQGGYLAVDAAVGHLIDWYNVQFYNQGVEEYVDCPGLLTQSSSNNPHTSVFEIAANGVELNKLVIGKPASMADANNGFMSTDLLAQCVAEAKSMDWAAGAMLFQFSSNLVVWIEAVRGDAFPIGPTMPI
ncbi:glycoside hydrolase family 18 protein [Piloderma croceum F 1598]|uniref:Glycoside hydrolase family 18 protein n=1 Tax=Piloderma croceum (strain F 1598) TaxID=765440 RepID=A0A0C3FHE3_PILCF|nr:glycoside hydrolase family 18 protein [Piloderma croceum F 1598]